MRFRDQLRDDLKAVVAERARSKAIRRLGWQPKVLLAGGFTAALVASMVVVNGTGTEPAWSVQKQDNGMVKMHVNYWTDPEGLENELEKYVANAEVQVAPLGKKCSDDWYEFSGNTFKSGTSSWVGKDKQGRPDTFAWAFHPEDVPPDTTLIAYHEIRNQPEVVHTRDGSGKISTMKLWSPDDQVTIAKGNVGPCDLVPDNE